MKADKTLFAISVKKKINLVLGVVQIGPMFFRTKAF